MGEPPLPQGVTNAVGRSAGALAWMPEGNIINLNVGGKKFTTSRDSLNREPASMLGRMFSSGFANTVDDKGRIFIDRDYKHFGVILNYLRDGTCVLPTDTQALQELLQEVDFYQLEGMKAFLGADARWRPHSAQLLKHCITSQLQADAQLKAVVALLLECAYGRAIYCLAGGTPPRHAQVSVALRESAFNPLSPQAHLQNRDETLFVGFQQHIAFQGPMHKDDFDAKHEANFIHDGAPSYDPTVYGGTYPARFHIKTMKVYEQHCQHQLPCKAQQLRAATLFIAEHEEAVRWGLEICGFRDVSLHFHARPSSCKKVDFVGPCPVLCEMSCVVSFSL